MLSQMPDNILKSMIFFLQENDFDEMQLRHLRQRAISSRKELRHMKIRAHESEAIYKDVFKSQKSDNLHHHQTAESSSHALNRDARRI
jgi:hypothetical protein